MSDLPQPTLPRLMILQSENHNKYLRFDKTNPSLGALRSDHGDYSRGLDTKLEVVPSNREGPVQEKYGFRHRNQLVHIRSLYNNKFWKKTRNSNEVWITATAETTDENPDSPDCTVFQVEFVHQYSPYDVHRNCILLRPEKSEHYLHDNEEEDEYKVLKLDTYPSERMYKFIDLESLVTLPERIRIKGDNGNYLRAYPNDAYMGFDPNMDNSDAFDFAVSETRDGGIRLKNLQYGKYWRVAPSCWVLADEGDSPYFLNDTVFIPTELGGNKIGLRCLGSYTFCKRLTKDNKTNCLGAHRTYPDETSYLEIEEPVIKRTINNVHYIFDEARRYDETPFAVVTDTVSNGSDAPPPLISEISFCHTVKNSTHWTNSNTVKVGVEASFKAKVILVGETEFKFSGEYTHAWDKEESKDEELKVETKKTISVPPKTKMQAIVKGTRLSFEIPYTYTQHDTLKNGQTKVYEKKDGLFKATNGYGYETEIVTLPY